MILLRRISQFLTIAAVLAIVLSTPRPALAAPGALLDGSATALAKVLHDLGGWLFALWPDLAKDGAGMDPDGNPSSQGGAGMDPDGNPTAQGGAGMDPNGYPGGADGAGMDPNGGHGLAVMRCGDDTAGMDPDGVPCTP